MFIIRKNLQQRNTLSISEEVVTVIGLRIYTQRQSLAPPYSFEMTNDTTSITRLLTRLSQERNGDLLGHYIGYKKPQKISRKMLI